MLEAAIRAGEFQFNVHGFFFSRKQDGLRVVQGLPVLSPHHGVGIGNPAYFKKW